MLNTLCRSLRRSGRHCVKRAAARGVSRLLGGGYLRLPMSLTIAVVGLRALCQEERGGALALSLNHFYI